MDSEYNPKLSVNAENTRLSYVGSYFTGAYSVEDALSNIGRRLDTLENGGSKGTVTAAETDVRDAGGWFSGSTVEAVLQEIGADIRDLRELTGLPDGSSRLSAMTGTTIPDGSSLMTAFQALETAVEAAHGDDQTASEVPISDPGNLLRSSTTVEGALQEGAGEWTSLRWSLGTMTGESNMGVYFGGIISDHGTVKTNIQELATAVDGNLSQTNELAGEIRALKETVAEQQKLIAAQAEALDALGSKTSNLMAAQEALIDRAAIAEKKLRDEHKELSHAINHQEGSVKALTESVTDLTAARDRRRSLLALPDDTRSPLDVVKGAIVAAAMKNLPGGELLALGTEEGREILVSDQVENVLSPKKELDMAT